MISTTHSWYTEASALDHDQQERLAMILDEALSSSVDSEKLAAEHPDLVSIVPAYLQRLRELRHRLCGFLPGELSDARRAADDLPQLGDYRIVREIARGGMGIVYEAEQRSLRRRVAIKVLSAFSSDSRKQTARFEVEAQAAAQLNHPNIVPIYAVGQESETHFYVMRFIDGHPLESVLARLRGGSAEDSSAIHCNDDNAVLDRLTDLHVRKRNDYFSAVVRCLIQAAEAIHAAHEVGVIHRDIKPSNLLVDARHKVWVTDFGLARIQDELHLTKTGDFVGTMRYMSPEQAHCIPAMVDHRTDVYSLGVTLYELLTGRHMLRASDTAGALRELERDKAYRPTLHDRSIPRDLENIVLKAVAKQPAERYQTAAELAADLQRFVDGKPTVARSPNLMTRLHKWARRHQTAVLVAVAVLLVVVGILGATSLAIARQKAELITSLQLQQLETARAANNLGLLHQQIGDREQAEAELQAAVKTLQTLQEEGVRVPAVVDQLATSLSNLSGLHRHSDPRQAQREARRAADLREELVRDHPNVSEYQRDLARQYNRLASIASQLDDFDAAKRACEAAVAVLTVAHEGATSASHDLALTYNNLGSALLALDRDDAAATISQALALQEKLVEQGQSSSQMLSQLGGIFHNQGAAHERNGEHDAAAASYENAVRRQAAAAVLAPEARRYRDMLAKHYSDWIRILRRQNRYSEADDAAAEWEAFARKQATASPAPSLDFLPAEQEPSVRE